MRKMSFECQSPDQVFRVMRMDRLTGSVAEKALIGKSVADQKGPQPSPVSPSFALLFKALDSIKLKPSTQLLKGKHVDILFGADILILSGNSHQRSSKRRKHMQKITLTTSDSSGTVLPFCRLITGLNSHPFPAQAQLRIRPSNSAVHQSIFSASFLKFKTLIRSEEKALLSLQSIAASELSGFGDPLGGEASQVYVPDLEASPGKGLGKLLAKS